MKYGLICPVCDRLLWKGERKLSSVEELVGKGWKHATEGTPFRPGQPFYWCGCKPHSSIKQTDLAEAQ